MSQKTPISRVAVISGIPGAGKSTLARRLANQHKLGLHLEADQFFGFLTHPVDPFSLESREQADTMARVVAATARAFADGGYVVFVDGVIGPEEEGVALLRQFFQRYPEVLARHRLNAATDMDAVMNEFENRRAAGELVRLS